MTLHLLSLSTEFFQVAWRHDWTRINFISILFIRFPHTSGVQRTWIPNSGEILSRSPRFSQAMFSRRRGCPELFPRPEGPGAADSLVRLESLTSVTYTFRYSWYIVVLYSLH